MAQALLRFLEHARQSIDFRLLACDGIADFMQCLFLEGQACFQLDAALLQW